MSRQNKVSDNKLLREYVRKVLAEYQGDGGGTASAIADAGFTAADISAASGAGSGSGSAKKLGGVFFTPFTDAFKTAVGKTKELTRKARTLLTVGFKAIISTLIPGLGVKYGKIFEQEKSDIAKIRSQYKDVYERTEKALSSNDAAFLAFMASPEKALSAWAVSKSPEFVSSALSTVTGGLSDKLYEKILDGSDSKLVDKLMGKIDSLDKTSDATGKKKHTESRIYEGEDQKKKEIFSNPQFISAALKASDEVEDMKAYATKIYRNTLNQIFDQAKKAVEGTNTMEELEKITGGDIKTEAIHRDRVNNVLFEILLLEEEESKASEAALVNGVKDAVKKFYVEKLSDQVKKVVAAGIPKDSQYVSDYEEVIKKIESL